MFLGRKEGEENLDIFLLCEFIKKHGVIAQNATLVHLCHGLTLSVGLLDKIPNLPHENHLKNVSFAHICGTL
jgi:hypothetical protein